MKYLIDVVIEWMMRRVSDRVEPSAAPAQPQTSTNLVLSIISKTSVVF